MPKNPVLYAKLKQLAKNMNAAPPQVINAGDEFTYQVVRHDNGKYAIHALSGEEYRIDCPFCTDVTQRLYVHYMYGCPSPDMRAPPRMFNLAYCQNEQQTQFKLRTALDDYEKVLNLGLVQVDKSTLANQPLEGIDPYEQVPPSFGKTVPLNTLPGTKYAQYWLDRGHDLDYLSDSYLAQVCVEHEDDWYWKMLKDRVIFPYLFDGRVIMWQARLNWTPPKRDRQRKWWFPAGTKKVLFNMDMARKFPVAVICEGISSALCAGPAAMSVGGKTMSHHMLKFIKEHFRRVMVMLDPDAGVNRKMVKGTSKREKDYQQRMLERLQSEGVEAIGAAWTEGDDRDPGDLGMRGTMELIRRTSKSFARDLGYAA